MGKRKLQNVTLVGIDCVNLERLELAAKICQTDFEFADVKLLTSIPSNNPSVVQIEPINSTEEYSHFVLSKLDDYFTTSHVLVFQYDGFILNPSAWTDEYLQYDYIGAPWLVADWAVENFDFPPDLLGKLVVGNGGFSLRSKKLTKLCKEMMEQNLFPRYHPEDTAIGVYQKPYLESKGIQYPPIELAKQFSFELEDDLSDSWNDEFGFHGLSYTDISKWTSANPEFNIDNPGALKKKLIMIEPTPEQKEKMRKDLQFIGLVSRIAKELECRIVIAGGYAIDAALGQITRYHNDIDMQIYSQNPDALNATKELLAKIGNQDSRFADFTIEEKDHTEFYKNFYVKIGTQIIDIYYLQTTTDPFAEKKIIMKNGGDSTPPHPFETQPANFKSAAFEIQIPLIEAVEKIRKRGNENYPNRDKDEQDILNLHQLVDEQSITQRLANHATTDQS